MVVDYWPMLKEDEMIAIVRGVLLRLPFIGEFPLKTKIKINLGNLVTIAKTFLILSCLIVLIITLFTPEGLFH
jgi:hypothetical protein